VEKASLRTLEFETQKLIKFWGACDLASIIFYLAKFIWWKIYVHTPTHFVPPNNISILAIKLGALAVILSAISIVFSGYYLYRQNKVGALIYYFQVPFRLFYFPSLFFIFVPSFKIFDKYEQPYLLYVVFFLLISSEMLKLYSMIVWRKGLGKLVIRLTIDKENERPVPMGLFILVCVVVYFSLHSIGSYLYHAAYVTLNLVYAFFYLLLAVGLYQMLKTAHFIFMIYFGINSLLWVWDVINYNLLSKHCEQYNNYYQVVMNTTLFVWILCYRKYFIDPPQAMQSFNDPSISII